jgi:hypothetical protein
MNKIIIAFCEGQHDIAFLSRILFVDGFTFYNKKIKDFIKPLNKQYETELSKKKIADKKLGFQSEYMIPSVALHKDENILVLLHNLNGDSRTNERKEILTMYNNIQSKDDDFTNEFYLNFRFLYFFDADDKGIAIRVGEINSELDLSAKLEHNKINTIDLHEWGCYVFHKDKNSGDLEYILLDLMKQNNENIFINSEKFIEQNILENARQKRYICNNNEEKFNGAIQYKKEKSIISIAGQLQFSGSSNAVIIANSDYIKKSDMSNNIHCINISKLFMENI